MSNDLSHIGGQVPDKAYVGTAGSPNHVQGLASMTEQSVREQIRAQPDEVFGNANKSFLAQILSTAVKFVGDVIKGLVSVIQSIFDVFSGPRDWGPVHAALYAQLKPMVDATKEANEQAKEAAKKAKEAGDKATEAQSRADSAIRSAQTAGTRADSAISNAQRSLNDARTAINDSKTAVAKANNAETRSLESVAKATEANNKAIQANNKAIQAHNQAVQALDSAIDANRTAIEANNEVDRQQNRFIDLQNEVNANQQTVNQRLQAFDAEIERTRPRILIVPNQSRGKVFELRDYLRVEETVRGPGGQGTLSAQKMRVTALGNWRGYVAITFKGDGGEFDIFGMSVYPGASQEAQTGAVHVQWEGLIATCYPE